MHVCGASIWEEQRSVHMHVGQALGRSSVECMCVAQAFERSSVVCMWHKHLGGAA